MYFSSVSFLLCKICNEKILFYRKIGIYKILQSIVLSKIYMCISYMRYEFQYAKIIKYYNQG